MFMTSVYVLFEAFPGKVQHIFIWVSQLQIGNNQSKFVESFSFIGVSYRTIKIYKMLPVLLPILRVVLKTLNSFLLKWIISVSMNVLHNTIFWLPNLSSSCNIWGWTSKSCHERLSTFSHVQRSSSINSWHYLRFEHCMKIFTRFS